MLNYTVPKTHGFHQRPLRNRRNSPGSEPPLPRCIPAPRARGASSAPRSLVPNVPGSWLQQQLEIYMIIFMENVMGIKWEYIGNPTYWH